MKNIYVRKNLKMEEKASIINWLSHCQTFDLQYYLIAKAMNSSILKHKDIYIVGKFKSLLCDIEIFFKNIYSISLEDFEEKEFENDLLLMFLQSRFFIEETIDIGVSFTKGIKAKERIKSLMKSIESFSKKGINREKRSNSWSEKIGISSIKQKVKLLTDLYFDELFGKNLLQIYSIISLIIHKSSTKMFEKRDLPWLLGHLRYILLILFSSFVLIDRQPKDQNENDFPKYKTPNILSTKMQEIKFIFSEHKEIDFQDIILDLKSNQDVENFFFELTLEDSIEITFHQEFANFTKNKYGELSSAMPKYKSKKQFPKSPK